MTMLVALFIITSSAPDLGAFLSSNFSPIFFSSRKTGKTETFPKFGNLKEGKIFGRLHIPIFGKKKKKNMEIQNCAKNILRT